MDVDLEGALLVVVDGGVDGLPEVVGSVGYVEVAGHELLFDLWG